MNKKKQQRQYAQPYYKDLSNVNVLAINTNHYHNHLKKNTTELDLKNKQKKNNSQFSFLRQPKTQDLAKKIIQNYQATRAFIPPASNKQNQRQSSIRIVNKQQKTGPGGAYYLISKSGINLNYGEKKHIPEKVEIKSNFTEKKHFKNIEPTQKQEQSIKIKDNINIKKRINNDIMSCIPQNQYSRPEHKDSSSNKIKKAPSNLMFKTSYQAGFEAKRVRVTSAMKITQMMGNGLDKQKAIQKIKRGDFQKSTIIFG